MKKLLVSVTYLKDIGGISTAAINLINEIHNLYDITLCIPADYVSTKYIVPDNVKIVRGSSYIHDVLVDRQYLSQQNILRKCIRNIRRVFNHYIIKEKGIERALNRLFVPDEYDVAIAFGDFMFSYKDCRCFDYEVVLNNVKARRKIAWIHNDPLRLGWTREKALERFLGFDAVVNVSKDCKRVFDELVPEFKGKSFVVYNMYDTEQIRLKSGFESPYAYNGKYHFLTVCRLDEGQKRVSRILEVCKRLKSDGYCLFDWTIVGDGNERSAYESASQSNGTTDIMHFTGAQSNPYPYMRFADAFILSSLFEGLPITIREAQITGTPTFSTRFGAAEEAIAVGKQGDICDNSIAGLYLMIKSILDNPGVLIKYRGYLFENPVDNKVALEQFDSIVCGTTSA